jgi:hypothetical protein
MNYIGCAYRKAWIMWDLDNGHISNGGNGKGYMWVFSTRKEAVEHRQKQHKSGGARLSKPIKITQ